MFCSHECSAKWHSGSNNPMYGRHHTDDSKRKMSEHNVSNSPDVKEKNSKAHIGKNARVGAKHPMYGKHHTEEAKERISKAHIGRPRPLEIRQKISNAHKGMHQTEETKQKISHTKIGVYVGKKNPNWKGGISTWPYCSKFNNSLKEEIRTKFGRRCFLSGVEENGRKLAVHHCDYLKSQGCQGQRWSLLPLEHSWHSKTNANRWYWFSLLRDYWVYKYITFHGMDIFEGPSRSEWLWEMYNGL